MRPRPSFRIGALVVAAAASLGLVLGSPYTGQIRGALQDALPGQYRMVIGASVVGAVAIALAAALQRIRERRAQRYGLLIAAIGAGASYAWTTATGNVDVDLVERFHLVEYGVLTWLFSRVWHSRGDVTSLVFPALAAFAVGICDEGLQWLVPARVGELRDVLLNGVSIGCGLLFSVAVQPLTVERWMPDRGGRRALAASVAAAIVLLAAFVHAVHLGHEIDDPQAGRFLSRYSATELQSAARDRAERWQSAPPRELHRLSIEDHYLAEGAWHVQRRNEVDDPQRVWYENLILEKYFAPVLDFPTYATGAGAKWPDGQRANAAAAAAGVGASTYRSTANPYPIYTWNPLLFWSGIIAALAVLTGLMLRPGDRHRIIDE